MKSEPILNITIPVFNRYELTQRTILALRKTSQQIPFSITVVDNGSDSKLVKRLIEFEQSQIIDYLYLLSKNMGISCACNIGWRLIDAPYYMKLDNDTVMTNKNWLVSIFNIWKYLEPFSNIGGAYSMNHLIEFEPPIYTPGGIAGVCHTNLPGQAIIIPKAVSYILGYWSEDYGLYGAEDGDYGIRMNCIGFKQYYYCGSDYFINLGKNDEASEYNFRGIDKKYEHTSLFKTDDGKTGLFQVNNTMYNFCIRSWNPILKYEISDIYNKYYVILKESDEYKVFRRALDICAEKIRSRISIYALNPSKVYADSFIRELKMIMKDVGQDCEAMQKRCNLFKNSHASSA